uniref:Nonstructural protein n=1 Tax=Dulem virus 205 TaxID=3145682 RepID=A0AAU8B826_9VIRU
MIVNIYSIRDELAETYGNLFLVQEKVAMRQFAFMQKEMEEADRKDRVIYLMGTYNIETGEIKTTHPKAIFRLDKEGLNG